MENLILVSPELVNAVIDQMCSFVGSLSDVDILSTTGSNVTLAFAMGASSPLSEGILANLRRWHGKIGEQFENIDNLYNVVMLNQLLWKMPDSLLTKIQTGRQRLQILIPKCNSSLGTQIDREERNSVLKDTVDLCLLDVRVWAYGEFVAGVLTADDVHTLGFLLPGETGGRRSRTEATDAIAEIKVRPINEDFVSTIIDQAANANAGPVLHGWPPAVNNALIVIIASDGVTEVHRQFTTHLHNDIRMPEGSHGKQFIAKAAFLKHIDDEPRFGSQTTFSMPLTTEDILAAKGRQHDEDLEAQQREVERQRQEIERLQAELKEKNS
jgi:hypothetical protein